MGIYIEMLILYIVLFFSASTGSSGGEGQAVFSIFTELTRMLLYNIPSLALIWYLLLKAKRIKDWDIMPGKRDIISVIIALPCMLITGYSIAYVSSRIGGASAQVSLSTPPDTAGWVILSISCLTAAYLEESFFRFYILSRRSKLNLSAAWALIVSVALFSICHIYEGPWGFLNAVISGTVLSVVFLRYKSLHGIAIAHWFYNFSVYAVSSTIA
ncbi:MAG: CPBP family intramembrane metalloprotease [Treponema sp.]|jgi:membrane protease YdiL (CAAX protease family)|nr:CPBP family intramembrane metalloprotease [Treponema sp.]